MVTMASTAAHHLFVLFIFIPGVHGPELVRREKRVGEGCSVSSIHLYALCG